MLTNGRSCFSYFRNFLLTTLGRLENLKQNHKFQEDPKVRNVLFMLQKTYS